MSVKRRKPPTRRNPTPEERATLVELARKEFDRVAIDLLMCALEAGEEALDGDCAREHVADSLCGSNKLWSVTTFESHDEILREAIPFDDYA